MSVEKILDDFVNRLNDVLKIKTGWGRVELTEQVNSIVKDIKAQYKDEKCIDSPPWELIDNSPQFPSRIVIQVLDDGVDYNVTVSTDKLIKTENESTVTIDGYDYDITKQCNEELDKLFFGKLN